MSVLGSIEYSAEYIRLYNLLSRCRNCRRGCRKGNSINKPEWRGRLRTLAPGNRIRAPRRKTSNSLPCIFHCSRITADDVDCYDILRFEEFQLDFEPMDDEAFVHRDAFADVDENGTWMRICVTSLSD